MSLSPPYILKRLPYKAFELLIFILSDHYELRRQHDGYSYRMWDVSDNYIYDKIRIYWFNVRWMIRRGIVYEQDMGNYVAVKGTEEMVDIHEGRIPWEEKDREGYIQRPPKTWGKWHKWNYHDYDVRPMENDNDGKEK